MGKLQQAWEDYRDALFPQGGLSAEQNKQLHQAFFAGALCFMIETEQIAALPDAQAVTGLGQITRECLEINSSRVSAAKARN
ncbi:MAG: hypothetical protein H7Y43_00930 [Akkermansiaceae bacterium]|nr:hypothetical protein [Verrucomicrobiales bacterium]